jgi:hemolysin activation/secretion protein
MISRPNLLSKWLFGLLLLSPLASLNAAAQTTNPPLPPPPPIAPGVERSDIAPGTIPPAEGHAQAPPGAADAKFTLLNIEVGGEFPEVATRSREIIEPWIGTQLSVADIYDIAARMQNAYFAAGFPLARVAVPPQSLEADKPSAVHLLVIDGYIERIDASGVPSANRSQVEGALAPLEGRRHLTQDELNRHVLLAGDVAGVSLRSALGPGATEGGTVLLLSGTHEAIVASLSYDNSLPKELDRHEATISVSSQSLLHLGEVLSVTYSGDPSDEFIRSHSPRRYADGYISLPLNHDGLSLMLDYASARSNPVGNAAPAAVHSDFDRALMRATYAFIRERQVNLFGWMSLEAVDQKQTTSAVKPTAIIGNDRLRVLRIGADASGTDSHGGLTKGSLRLSQGLDTAGARSRSDASLADPLSRAGAGPTFTTLLAQVDNTERVGKHLESFVSTTFQTSFGQPLLTSEQMVLGGPGQLSSFDQGAVVGDQGAMVRGELRVPLTINRTSFAGSLKPYLFGAYGVVQLREPSASEHRVTHAASYGPGLTARLVTAHSLTLDGYSECGLQKLTGEHGSHSRFLFGLSAHF